MRRESNDYKERFMSSDDSICNGGNDEAIDWDGRLVSLPFTLLGLRLLPFLAFLPPPKASLSLAILLACRIAR